MEVRLVTPAAVEPVSLAEVKAHCRIDGDADDALLQSLMIAVRRHGEALTNRVFVTSEWELRFQNPLGKSVVLPVNPCTACVSVHVDGSAVDPQLYSFTPSALQAQESPMCALLNPAEAFPAGAEIVMRVQAGWPVDSFPADIKAWMLVRINTLYEQRESVVAGIVTELRRGFVDCLLDAYRIHGGM